MDRDVLDRTTLAIIQAAIEVHRHVGPGLLESIYRACMVYELREKGLAFTAERRIPLTYKQRPLDGTYRIDLLVEDAVIVELKSVEMVLPVHYAQVLSYLRLTGKPVGLLINFNVSCLVKGVKRVVNKY
jgi:GxxExxY protein